jgi:hypothetical protein
VAEEGEGDAMSEVGEYQCDQQPFSMSDLLSLSEVDRVAVIAAVSLAVRGECSEEAGDD